jgi:hypothetical protein
MRTIYLFLVSFFLSLFIYLYIFTLNTSLVQLQNNKKKIITLKFEKKITFPM